MNYKIIENFLKKEDSDLIENILTSNYFPWYYNPEVIRDGKGFMFYHNFSENSKINSNFFYKLLIPIFNNFKNEINIIYRARVNCHTQQNKNINYGLHVDHNFDHKVLLYYVNTNNGYTNLENKVKIPCLKNKIVLMDGNINHEVVSQTDTKLRIAINITYN